MESSPKHKGVDYVLQNQGKSEIRQLEDLLRSYPDFKMTMLNLKKSLELNISIRTTTYSDNKGIGTSTKFSPTEEAFLDRCKANERIEEYQSLIDLVEHGLSLLSFDERQFIEMRFFKRFSISKISNEMLYSVRQIHRIRKKALDRLLIVISPFLVEHNRLQFRALPN